MSGAGSMVIENPDFVPDQVKAHAYERGNFALSKAIQGFGASDYRGALMEIVNPNPSTAIQKMRDNQAVAMAPVNAIAKAFRANPRLYQGGGHGRAQPLPTGRELVAKGEIAKSVLDVGSLTNFASITGGQALGYVSLDTDVARGTVRPSSFTLYQALHKSAAFQIVDYWAYINDLGGAIPGAAFGSYSSVSSGTLNTNVGRYALENVTLKLMFDARAMTVALASQNSFIDIPTQESANAALTILQTANYASYYGDSAIYANQFDGLVRQIPAANVADFQPFYNGIGQAESWSKAQAAYNLIYETAANVTSWNTFGQITHAFMSPKMNASLQGLVTTTLNNLLNVDVGRSSASRQGIVVNGDLQGMRTRFGEIQFVLDLFINARLAPQQSFLRADGTNPATISAPTPPSGVTATTIAASSVVGTSYWTASFAPTGATNSYVYAVAGMGPNSEESVLAYSGVVTGIAVNGGVALSIAPASANDITAVRIYRSGLGYSKTTTGNTPYSFRLIATVAATGTTTIAYNDLNADIPGGENIFLLDLAEEDNALDWRFLLPLSKIELFAQNLYMPWAVAMIGALRVRIPKFHARIKNVVPDEPDWNPLAPNN
jgi:hypothetical protein